MTEKKERKELNDTLTYLYCDGKRQMAPNSRLVYRKSIRLRWENAI